MNCPRCATPTTILESRDVSHVHSHRRRHRCPGCRHRFTTYEFVLDDPLCVELDEMETPRGPVSGFFVLLPFSRTLKAALARQRRSQKAVKA